MFPRRFAPPLLVALLLAGAPATAAEAPPDRLSYSISVASLPIARADMVVAGAPGRYAAEIAWRTVGIAGIFAAASGSVSAAGRIAADGPHPNRYRLTSSGGGKTVAIALAFAGRHVAHAEVSPPTQPSEDLVPLTAAHRDGVVDPLSAALIPGAVRPADVCARTLPVYDGWSRWDVRLAPAETREATFPGLRGPTVVCSARWVPVAGHRTEHRSVRYMADNRDIEIHLARLAGRDLWLPIEASVGTMIGTARARLDDLGK